MPDISATVFSLWGIYEDIQCLYHPNLNLYHGHHEEPVSGSSLGGLPLTSTKACDIYMILLCS